MKTDIEGQIAAAMEAPAPKRWEEVFLDLSEEMPEEPPVLVKINGASFAFKEGTSIIGGSQKSGKTTFCRPILSSLLAGKPIMSVEVKSDISLLLVDTEMPKFRILAMLDKAFKMAGMERGRSDRLSVISLREYAPDERLQIISDIIEDRKPDLVILDNVTDLMTDTNDNAQAAALVDKLLALSKNCGLICVCHTNPGNAEGKLRGHIGSELMRKCEASLIVTKSSDGLFTVKPKDFRGRPFEPFSFVKDNDDNILPAVSEKPISAKDRIASAMEVGRDYTSAELVGLLGDSVPPGTAKSAIHELCREGRILNPRRNTYTIRTGDS